MPLPWSSSRIHSATLSRKYRSCVIATHVPAYVPRKPSSQATLSASRWLVGSSSNSISGFCNSSLQSATRLLSPPDNTSTLASESGQRRASIARSSVRSSSQPFAASIPFCTLSISLATFSFSSSVPSLSCVESSVNRNSKSRVSCTASSMFSITVLSSDNLGSCSR
mmetsp:Transcript_54965/g.89061  ORF Transcript_54965/g.89061 Transcript_54965/m.89061 type:complete len:167 (-) Transcript_54965:222-722(-)